MLEKCFENAGREMRDRKLDVGRWTHMAVAGADEARRNSRTQGLPASVFNHIDYSTSSSVWVFSYQLPPAVSPLEESARVRYVAGANGRGTLRLPVMRIVL